MPAGGVCANLLSNYCSLGGGRERGAVIRIGVNRNDRRLAERACGGTSCLEKDGVCFEKLLRVCHPRGSGATSARDIFVEALICVLPGQGSLSLFSCLLRSNKSAKM